ncbi:hypothetical protein NDU88_001543 [Pleurodeles waltl]|uniref:Uncharacterized protein n=1 Tax=Pleurodeles waltl TaxID=8319 RepID=A0AAV7MT22_PLEWA|nr:hypothetical protein NDU88_001543 [Pleurodeles waltl]
MSNDAGRDQSVPWRHRGSSRQSASEYQLALPFKYQWQHCGARQALRCLKCASAVHYSEGPCCVHGPGFGETAGRHRQHRYQS